LKTPVLSPRVWLLLAFTLSGCSGLVYESLWTHYLKLFLGHAAYAQTLVLAIFMGGMAAGSWLCSRRSAGWPRPLRAYALAEGTIGLAALAFHVVFTASIGAAYGGIIPSLPSPEAVTAFKWALGAALILPQSVLLGMTFPLMAGGFMRAFPDGPGRSLATLYFCNSIGGVAGVLVSGFVLIPETGLAWTGASAGLLNVVIAIVVWRIDATVAAGIPARGASAATVVPRRRLLLATALLTGAASFIYEVGWIRMLSMVLGSSTHAFELMLSAFILGLACGGLWIRTAADRLADPQRFLGHVQILMGACAMATLPVYGHSFSFVRWLVETLPKTDAGYAAFNLGSHAVALAVMLPATFLAGTTLPLITLVLVRCKGGEASVGAVYGANTVGAIAGVTFAVHFGMPVLGLKGLLLCGAALDIGVGLALLWMGQEARRPVLWKAAAALVCVVIAGVWVPLDSRLMATGVFRARQRPVGPNQLVLFERHGKTASVAVTDNDGVIVIRTNGKIDATVNIGPDFHTGDEPTQVLAGALPLLLHPGARRVADIGLGSGVTSHVMLGDPRLESVDTIEIEAAMIEGARSFSPRNDRVFTDPRSRIVVDDAKTFFASQRLAYDIIVSEPSNPWVSGTASLFTQEFYALVRSHLAGGGVFAQWLQLYEFDVDLVASVLKALGREFGDYAIYAPGEGDLLIVAVAGGRVPELAGAGWPPRLSDELRRVSIRSAEDIARRKVASRQLLEPWLRHVDISANSDYRPTLDHRAVRARFLEHEASGLLVLGAGRLPITELLGGESGPPSPTRATPSRWAPTSPQPFLAMEIRDRLASAAPGPDALPATSMAGVRVGIDWSTNIPTPPDLAGRLLHSCAAAEGAERQAALFRLGGSLGAFLSREELERTWTRIETLPCVTTSPGESAKWVTLFRAMARRDPERMAAAAETLLASGLASDQQRVYVTEAGVLGYVASAQLDRARTLLRNVRAPGSGALPSFSLEVLAGHASVQ
jgi:predicted membrane-bound spermidine synthase